jgi:hypothetical protein
MDKEGYNDILFTITCNKCGENDCSIVEHQQYDQEGEPFEHTGWHIICNKCLNSDI